ELGLGTAALGSATASSGTVEATATIVPVRVSARRSFPLGPAGQLFVGPCVDVTYFKVTAASTTTPVRSATNLMVGLGAEAEARVIVFGSAWLFGRAAALGVLN